MPRRAPCAGCAKPMEEYRGSASAGLRRCRSCRLAARGMPRTRCAWCAQKFKAGAKSGGGWTEHCSKSCAQYRTLDEGRGPARLYSAVTPDQRRQRRKVKSRARHLARRMTWDGITDAEILERDRWICGICRKRIGRTYRYPHPRSASIDHIIPLAETHDDSATNKRAAHLVCNMRRGAGGGNEQLALISGLPERGGRTYDYTGRERRRTCAECGSALFRTLGGHRRCPMCPRAKRVLHV